MNTLKNISAGWRAGIGFALTIPFLLLDLAVVFHIQPLVSLIRPEGHTTLLEQVLLFVSLALIFLGGLVAFFPMSMTEKDGKRNWYALNILLGSLLMALSLVLTLAFGLDIYQCNILKIPNCD